MNLDSSGDQWLDCGLLVTLSADRSGMGFVKEQVRWSVIQGDFVSEGVQATHCCNDYHGGRGSSKMQASRLIKISQYGAANQCLKPVTLLSCERDECRGRVFFNRGLLGRFSDSAIQLSIPALMGRLTGRIQ